MTAYPTDPREEKLPVWARQLLEDTRARIVVRFPDAPDPRFAARDNDSGMNPPPQEVRERYMWKLTATHVGGVRARRVWICKGGFEYHEKPAPGIRGGGSRNSTLYWTEADAALAAQHNTCRDAARRVLTAMCLGADA
jgi:hypothetical protein